ncbi:MAG: DUF1326 domain-containing protein [bacterium]|nr:DUF1326 domain-containing protein [bacterium]
MIDWRIEAVTFGNCTCDHNCPCQFELDPTQGYCYGMEVGEIERGHFGDLRLDGLRFALTYAWPGPIHEGNGAMQTIIDARAGDAQRAALETLLHGGETEEARTHWRVFHAMATTVHDTLFLPIELDIDVDRRRASVSIPGVMEGTGQPIISPATGAEHRVRIDIPHGIEFEIAEVGIASTTSTAAVPLDLRGGYAQFSRLHHTGKGPVRTRGL